MTTALKSQSLRDSLAKTVKMLTRQQVRVTFSGHQPYVQSKGDKIVRLNLPEINDNASELLLEALSGYVDHECGHIFYTPFGRFKELIGGDPVKAALLNIVEDIRLEKLLPRDLPGTKDNLERMYDKFIPLLLDAPTKKGAASPDPAVRVSGVLVPALRALAGQAAFQRYMDANDFWQHFEPVMKRMPALGDQLKALETYDDVVDLVDDIIKALGPRAKPPAFNANAPQTDDEEDKEGDDDDATPGVSSTEFEDDDSDEDGVDDENDDDAEDANAGQKSEGSEDEGDDDQSPGAPDDGDDDDEEEGEKGEGRKDRQDSDDESDESDESDDADGVSEQGDAKPFDDEDDAATGAPVADEDGDDIGSPLDDFEGKDRTDEDQDVDDATAEGITLDPTRMLDMDQLFSSQIEQMIKDEDGGEFHVFTRDYDRVLDIRDTDNVPLDQIDAAVASATGPMQNELRRLIAARTQSRKFTGRRSGKLHGPNLHRLIAGDDRVFYKRSEQPQLDTAISLVIDCSGSMAADAKMPLAAESAYAIGTVLARLGVPFECLGFTSGSNTDHVTPEYLQRVEEANALVTIQRFMPIDMPKFKTFDEPWNIPVRRRLAKCYNSVGANYGFKMGSTPEGCGIEFAARRLLQRPEHRKLMIVMTDGEPGADLFPSPKQDAFAYVKQSRRVVRAISDAGIDLVGVGIKHAGPTRYYPNSIVIDNVAQLPAALMGALKKFMLK